MKWSKYNHITRSSKHGIFIFNSVTNSFIKIDPELLEEIEAVENWSAGLKKFEDDFVKVLLRIELLYLKILILRFFCKKSTLNICLLLKHLKSG